MARLIRVETLTNNNKLLGTCPKIAFHSDPSQSKHWSVLEKRASIRISDRYHKSAATARRRILLSWVNAKRKILCEQSSVTYSYASFERKTQRCWQYGLHFCGSSNNILTKKAFMDCSFRVDAPIHFHGSGLLINILRIWTFHELDVLGTWPTLGVSQEPQQVPYAFIRAVAPWTSDVTRILVWTRQRYPICIPLFQNLSHHFKSAR